MVDIPEEGWQLMPDMNVKPLTKAELFNRMMTERQWKNYANQEIYYFDKWLRNWLTMQGEMKTHSYHMRFTTRMLLDKAGMKERTNSSLFSKCVAYYSTKVQPVAFLYGKKRKGVYTLSYKRRKKLPPYSVRLRIEEYTEQGKKISSRNLSAHNRLHGKLDARNKLTKANQQKRSQQHREWFNEYQRNRNKAIREHTWVPRPYYKSKDKRNEEDPGRGTD